MPQRGRKRRISESTCDSSSCVFCVDRFPHPPDTIVKDITQEPGTSSSESDATPDFDSWLKAQQSERSLLAEVDLSKMGLPTHQLDAFLSKQQGCDTKEAKKGSNVPYDSPFQHLSSQHSLSLSPQTPQTPQQDSEVPWSWSDSWQDHSEPVPARFREVASFQQPSNSNNMRQHTADILCGLEFSPDARFLATAGVAKQVRLYSLAGVLFDLNSQANERPIVVQRMPSKLSSLAWDHNQQGVVTVGDYDGTLSQLHLESGHFVADREENDGKRVWSVAHSTRLPNLALSASDDGTAKLWGGVGLQQSAGIIRPAPFAPICDASFCPYDSNLVALASANHDAYVYDMRNLAAPVHTLTGHNRSVSYARFLGSQRVITASVDGSLACWDLPLPPEVAEDQVVPDWQGNFSGTASFSSNEHSGKVRRRFYGHQNAKNFVGLSVRPEDGLMACGSETSTVYAYNTHWSGPVAQHDITESEERFDLTQSAYEPDIAKRIRRTQFVSAVDWMPVALQQQLHSSMGPLLAAAMSVGNLKLLSLNSAGGVSEEES